MDGAPLIIDFGHSKKISDVDLYVINNYFTERKYDKILKTLCFIGRSNNLSMINSEYIKFYGWVYGNYNYYYKTRVLMNEKEKDNLNLELDDINKKKRNSKNKLNLELDDINKKREIQKINLIKYFEQMHFISPNNYPILPIKNNNIKNRIFISNK